MLNIPLLLIWISWNPQLTVNNIVESCLYTMTGYIINCIIHMTCFIVTIDLMEVAYLSVVHYITFETAILPCTRIQILRVNSIDMTDDRCMSLLLLACNIFQICSAPSWPGVKTHGQGVDELCNCWSRKTGYKKVP